MKALRGVPAGVDVALVRKAYDRLAKLAAYRPYGLAYKDRPEHATGLVDALGVADSLEASFLLAALPKRDRDGDELSEEGLSRFMRAAIALNKIGAFVASAAGRESAERVRFVADDPILVAAVREALSWRGLGASRDLKEWLWFVSVLAMEGSADSAAALRPYVDAARENVGKPGFAQVDVLHRLLGHFAKESKPIAALVALLARLTCMTTNKRAPRYWSARVTETSDAMDLEHDVFKRRDPKAIARAIRAQPSAQVVAVPLGDVDAHVPREPHGEEPLRAAPPDPRAPEGRAPRPLRKRAEGAHEARGVITRATSPP